MDSEIGCLFLFKRSEGIFERSKVGLDDEQTGFLLTLTNPFSKVLKIVGVGDL